MIRAVLGLLLAVAPLAPARAAARDWSQVATRLPNGDYAVGNPQARVQLVEYLSFTCSHCAVMEKLAVPPLMAGPVARGQVRYEVRHALRDSYDLVATLLARCNGPAAFFRVAPAVYAAQPEWMARAETYGDRADPKLPPDQAVLAAAQGSGLLAFFTAHGLQPQRARACLTDAGERKRLSDAAAAAWNQPNFPGTPDLLLNGRELSGIEGWPQLDAAIAAALHRNPGSKP